VRPVIGQDLRERECGFDGEADGAEACGVEGVKCWDWGDQEFECEEGNEEVEEELPVSAGCVVSTSQISRRRGTNSRLRRPPLPEVIGSGYFKISVLCP